MRPLTEEETKAVFEKLHKYIGKNIRKLVEIPSSKNADGDDGDDKPSTSSDDDAFVFRLHRNRVYYVRASLMRRATSVSRDRLVHLGTAVGRLTHSGKFRLTVGALDLLSQHAKYKIWLKPSAEMQFLYGNHVLKSGLGRITEATPAYAGVVILNMADVPLGFGVAAKSTSDCRRLDPSGIVAFHQSDVGEYLRKEDDGL